jgi:oligoribonuclease (3'-5' exoribonuclease)
MESKVFLGMDIETTGQYLGVNAMIALGMVVLDENLQQLESFSIFLEEDGAEREQRCMDEFWAERKELFEKIMEQAIDPEEAMNAMVDWLLGVEKKYANRLVVLSDNPSFDVAWINYYLAKYTKHPMLYYGLAKTAEGDFKYEYRRIWDTDSAFHGALAATQHKVVEWGLEKELGVQNEKWSNTHDVIADASNIAANYALFIKKMCNVNILKIPAKKQKTSEADGN